ncbi:MAG: hypothetical protein MJ191_05275 [Clostridium sp.]|nr:hypothetical protein [Clostridium sp.]
MAKKDYSALVANVMQPSTPNNVVPTQTPTVENDIEKEAEVEVRTIKTEKTQSKKDKVFSAIIDEELLEKMRYIAKNNNLSFKAVIEASFKKSITSFEEKNGTIIIHKKEWSSAEDLF